MAGTDVECGFNYTYKSIPDAVKRGLISEAEVDKHVMRLLEDVLNWVKWMILVLLNGQKYLTL